ncbi:Ectopic P granules protein 5, partial [Mortierella sp. GBA43]
STPTTDFTSTADFTPITDLTPTADLAPTPDSSPSPDFSPTTVLPDFISDFTDLTFYTEFASTTDFTGFTPTSDLPTFTAISDLPSFAPVSDLPTFPTFTSTTDLIPSADFDPPIPSIPPAPPSPPQQPLPQSHRSRPLGLKLNFDALRTQSNDTLRRLRELYSNDYLTGLSQRRTEFESLGATCVTARAEHEEVFNRLRYYVTAHDVNQQCKRESWNLQQSAKRYANKLWAVMTKTRVETGICGDGAVISHNYSFQCGEYQTQIAAKLEKTLERHFKIRGDRQVRAEFEEKTSLLWIKDHIASVLNSIEWASGTLTQQAPFDPQDPVVLSNARHLARIRAYLDILFFFERVAKRQPDFDLEAEERKVREAEELRRQAEEARRKAAEEVEKKKREESKKMSGEPETKVTEGPETKVTEESTTKVTDGPTMKVTEGPEMKATDGPKMKVTEGSKIKEAEEPKPKEVELSTSQQPDHNLKDPAVPSNQTIAVIHGWISLLSALLLRHGSYLDYEYLTLQVLRTPNIQSWAGASFVQCNIPDVWSKAFQDFYITELELVLCGAPLYKQASSHLKEAPSDLTQVVRPKITEDDYLAVLDQLDVVAFLNRLLLEYRKEQTGDGSDLHTSSEASALQLLTTVHHLFDILLHGLERLKGFTGVLNRIGQSLCRLTMILDGQYQHFTSLMYSPESVDDDTLSVFERAKVAPITFDMEFDYILADVTRGLFASPSLLWTYIPLLPFKHMSSLTTALLLEEVALENIEQWINFPLELLAAAPELNKLREKLGVEREGALPLLTALTNIAASRDRRGSGSKITDTLSLEQGIALTVAFLLLDITFLGEFRKDLALIMVDVCVQQFGNLLSETETTSSEGTSDAKDNKPTSPTRTKFASIASKVPQAITNLAIHHFYGESPHKNFMDWSWDMLGKLDLTEVPTISQAEGSRLEMLGSGQSRHPPHAISLIAFVNTVYLLLTDVGRDGNQFLQKGWDTLTGMLGTGKESVLLNLTAKLVPAIVLSAEDSSAHSVRFAELLHKMAIWKQDPMLAATGFKVVTSRELTPTKIPKALLGLWYLLYCHMERSKDLPDGPTKILKLWISVASLQKQTDHQEYVHIMDVVCLICFESGNNKVVKAALIEQHIRSSVEYETNPGVYTELMRLAQPGLNRVRGVVQERLQKILPVPQGPGDFSLLMSTWSLRSYAAHIFAHQNLAMPPIWFAYYVLRIESKMETDLRYRIGNYYSRHPKELQEPNSIVDVLKAKEVSSRKTLQNFTIWRWAHYLLVLPFDTFLLPLYWQMFFFLYFGHIKQGTLFYGYKFLEPNQTSPGIVEQLGERLQKTILYFERETIKATRESNSVKENAVAKLSKFYRALYSWINEPDLLTAGFVVPEEMMPDRLASCNVSDPMKPDRKLWMDLLVDLRAMSKGSIWSTPSSPSSPSPSPSTLPDEPLREEKEISDEPPPYTEEHSPTAQTVESDARFEGQCQPKTGPEFNLPPEIILRPSISMATTPENIFSQPIQVIMGYFHGFHETNDAYKDLNKSYLQELEALYTSTTKDFKKLIPCEDTPDARCIEPIQVVCEYVETVLNDQVRNEIIDNRRQAGASRLGIIEQELCLASLEIIKRVDALLELQQSDPGNTRIQGMCVQSFYFLCSKLLECARSYPPAQQTLRSIVDTLGLRIIANDPTQPEDILKFIGVDNFAAATFRKVFNPVALPGGFVRLYQQVATSSDYGVKTKHLLLRQFNVQEWIGHGSSLSEAHEDTPSAQDRRGFYEVALKSMMIHLPDKPEDIEDGDMEDEEKQDEERQDEEKQDEEKQDGEQQDEEKQDEEKKDVKGPKVGDGLQELILLHRSLAGTLLKNFLEQDYIEFLRILLNAYRNMCLETGVLGDFIRILGVDLRLLPKLLNNSNVEDDAGTFAEGDMSFTTISLSDEQLEHLAEFLESYFEECQWNLLEHFGGYTTSIASLLTAVLCEERYLTKWMRSSIETVDLWNSGYNSQSLDMEQFPLWRDTNRIFRPWLASLTNYPVDEPQNQRNKAGTSELLATFVGIISRMMYSLKRDHHDTKPMVLELFNYWLNIMDMGGQGKDSTQGVILMHEHFKRLNWEGLELTKDQVERILQVGAKLNDGARIEFWTYLVTNVMAKANSNYRQIVRQSKLYMGTLEWEDTESVLLKFGLKVLQDIEMMSDNGDESQLQGLLWDMVFKAADWRLLSSEALASHVDGLKSNWAQTGSWDSTTNPLGMLLRWMRITVGLESEWHDTDDDSLFRRQNRVVGSKDDRVLVYFDYVIRLLREELSPLAEDSQEINFDTDSIPSVIAHLGHVLEHLGQGVDRKTDAGFNRALSSLITLLNDSGYPAFFASRSSTSSPMYLIVLQGLQKMISELNLIHLDVIRVVSQNIDSTVAKFTLLEEAIEREFYLSSEQQESSLGSSIPGDHGTHSEPTSGMDDSASMATTNRISGHWRSSHRYSTYSSHSISGIVDTETGGRQSWSKIKTQIVLSELGVTFMGQGLEQGAILTIYGRFLLLLDDCEQDEDFEKVLVLGEEVANHISTLNLKAVEPWKVYQSLLLVRMFFDLVAKESLHDILKSRLLGSISLVCRTLEVWFQDQDSAKGVLGSIGMSTPSILDAKFRLVVRIVYTYVVYRLVNKGYSIHGEEGGTLWRRGKQNSGQGSASTALIDELAQLPTKRKDYEAVFTPPSAVVMSSGGMGSRFEEPAADQGLLSTRRKYGVRADGSATEQRLRLQYGTKDGLKDLEWAVEKIKDLRFNILETAEVMSELLDRFYENDEYFA